MCVTPANDVCVYATDAGYLYTWGSGEHGALGHGDSRDHLLPRLVKGIPQKRVLHVGCGASHTAVVLEGGAAYSWGANSKGQLGINSNSDRLAPQAVEALNGIAIAKVACGVDFTVFVAQDGRLFSCGNGEKGQLGHGNTESSALPQQIELNAKVSHIACGGSHCLAMSCKLHALFSDLVASVLTLTRSLFVPCGFVL
eukprot:GFYU01040257.1.p1 GENE.GFYU01040257.1~~GFYU01040257.1.p1  ORF type:complete len:221 (-),score=24.16 GFYU01040257.1:728-1321(-)